MSLVSGWQGDLVPTANTQTIQVPTARNADGSSVTGPVLASPQDLQVGTCAALAGNVFANYGDRLPDADRLPRITALPEARAMLSLAPGLLARGHAVDPALALPVYIRDKVASTTAERAAAHAAAIGASTSRP